MGVEINAPTMGNPLIGDIASLLQSPVGFGQQPAQRGAMDTFIPLALSNMASALTGNERYGKDASAQVAEEQAATRQEQTRIRNLQAADVLDRRKSLLQSKSDLLGMQFQAALATGNIQAASDNLDKQIKANADLATTHEKAEDLRQHHYLAEWEKVTGIQANAPHNRTGDPYLDQLLAQTDERRKIVSDLMGQAVHLKYKPNQFDKFLKEHPEAASQLSSFDTAALGKPLAGEGYEQFFNRAFALTGDAAKAQTLTKKLFPKAVFTDSSKGKGAAPTFAPTGLQRDLNTAMHPIQALLSGFLNNPYFTQPDTTKTPMGGGGQW